MVETLKLMIVDDNPEVIESLSGFFSRKKHFEIVGTAGNSIEAVKMLEYAQPDIIILDLIMPVADGFCLLEHLAKRKSADSPKTIVLSCINHESVISRACSLGADYYIIKPYDLEVLYSRVMDVSGLRPSFQKDSVEQQDLSDRLADLFAMLGTPDYTKGYKYLKECILMLSDHPDNIRNLSKSLYPVIASKYETNIFNVERSIRHTIDLTWNAAKEAAKGDSPILHFTYDSEKPSNRQFIAKVLKQLNSGV